MADDKKDENLPTNEAEALDFGKKKKKKKVKEDLFKESEPDVSKVAEAIAPAKVEYYTGKPAASPATEAADKAEGDEAGGAEPEEIDFGKKKTKKTKVKFDEDQNIEIEVRFRRYLWDQDESLKYEHSFIPTFIH